VREPVGICRTKRSFSNPIALRSVPFGVATEACLFGLTTEQNPAAGSRQWQALAKLAELPLDVLQQLRGVPKPIDPINRQSLERLDAYNRRTEADRRMRDAYAAWMSEDSHAGLPADT
jgi:hypothetical protein